MKLFHRSNIAIGWRAINFQPSEVLAAHVHRPAAGSPIISMIAAEQIEGVLISEGLTRLSKPWHGQKYTITTALQPGSYHFLPVDAPNVAVTELKSAIAWTVTSMIDFSNEEAAIDVLTVPNNIDGVQRKIAMYAVVTRSALTSDIHHRFQRAKLALDVIDIPEMAQRNIAVALESAGNALALISFDSNGGLLTFTGGGELYLARRIAITAHTLLNSDAVDSDDPLEEVALEIQRSLDHFARQFSWISVDRLVVAPLGEAYAGLVDYLAVNLELPITGLDLATIFDISQVPQLKSLPLQEKYFMTLGLALRHEEKVL